MHMGNCSRCGGNIVHFDGQLGIEHKCLMCGRSFKEIVSRETKEPKQKAVREQCSSKILQIYDRVSKANKGIAVALAESDRCSECQLSIPTKILESLKTSDDLIYCNSCGRILLRDSRK